MRREREWGRRGSPSLFSPLTRDREQVRKKEGDRLNSVIERIIEKNNSHSHMRARTRKTW